MGSVPPRRESRVTDTRIGVTDIRIGVTDTRIDHAYPPSPSLLTHMA